MLKLALGIVTATVLALSGCTAKNDTVAIREAIFEAAGGRTIYIREHVSAFDAGFPSPEERRNYSDFEFEPAVETLKDRDFGHLSVHVVSEPEYNALFSGSCQDGWRHFHARYPDAKALFELSAIGFRARHSEAVIYITGASGCLAARGDILLLKKVAERWTVVKTIGLRVS